MNKPIVSLIIPAYNVEKYITRCLQSLEKQSYGFENLEIILVDDASTDSTLRLLEEFEKKHEENVILVKCEKNGKLGTARNIGMSYATGYYMMFVDSDDLIDVSMIEKMVDIAILYDCEEVECGLKPFSEANELFVENDLSSSYFLDLSEMNNRKRFLRASLKTGVCGRLYKRSFIEENSLSFLEQIYYEDVHFSGIAMFLVSSYYRINETLYFYYQNAEGIIHSAYKPEKVHQEAEVMDILMNELDTRKLLDDVLNSYFAEFELYCIAKSFIDPLNMMLDAKLPLSEIRSEVDFFKEHILFYFPNASQNQYLSQGGGIFALGIWLLNVEKTRTEEVFEKRGKKNIVLMNTHEYINIGDHLITEATLAMLKDYYPEYNILEVTANHFLLERRLIRCCVEKGDVIVIVGGGYLGSLWLLNGEYNVRAIVEDYPGNRILAFPQSMFYSNDDEGVKELLLSRRYFEKHPNFHMILRDYRSYVLAQNVMPPNVNIYFYPDTALYCGFSDEGIERKGMGVCFRNDKEQSCDKNNIIRYALEIADKYGMEAKETDMLSPEVFSNQYRPQVVSIKAEEIAGYEIVVTDRLHCMIYCAITGTPCVAFDNISKKVSGVYQWIKELPYIAVIEKKEEMDGAVERVLQNKDSEKRPYDYLDEQFWKMASLVSPVDMPSEEEVINENGYVKYIDVNVGNENCNLRCEYCYIAQRRGYRDKLFSIPYDLDFLRRAFSLKRFGGRCLIGLGSTGETLLSLELIPVIRMLLEEGHYVMIVSNGTVAKAYDEIAAFPDDLRKHLFIKFSFHYLELKRLKLFDVFWSNVEKMKRAGISYTLEITPYDRLIPHIPDIKQMFEERANGAMPHFTIARDDRTGGIDILSELSVEEYEKTWGQFESKLFEFKMSLYHRKIKNYCTAGEKAFSLDLQSGRINQCVAHGSIGNLYDDICDRVEFDAIGGHCLLPYCFNGHLYLSIGLCEDIDAPTYYELRDREDREGNHWVNGEIKEIFLQRFE